MKFWELWSLYHLESWSLSGIYFPAMFRQAAKTLGLMLVVIFGSCMDIAAIQQDVPYRIDFNRELTTVAVSNIATGTAFVGFTGSYIFSQTIFTMRAGVTSRINGWVIAAIEAAAFLYPYSIVQYFPNYFLGALLVWFGVEISRDWLVLSYFKLTLVEYGLLWLTFASVMQWGLEGGIAAGIVCATLYFAYAYAQSQVQSLEAGRARSTVVRTVEHQTALGLLWDSHVATAHLQGFVFFGSAQSIGGKLHEIAARLVASTKEAESVTAAGASMDADGTQHSIGEEYGHGDKQRAAVLAVASAPRFFVIDFSKVTGMDSSGARTIASVCRELGAAGITPILTNTDHHGIVGLLNAHDVVLRFMKWPPELRPATPPAAAAAPLSPTASALIGAAAPQGEPGAHAAPAEDEPIVFLFRSREEGLRFCEDALLEVAVRFGLCTPPGAGTSLEELLSSHLDRLPLTSATNVPALAAKMRRYLQQQTVRRGEVLWNVGDSADELFLVERGVVRVDQFKLMYDDEEEESEEDVGEGKVEDVEAGPGGQRASHDGPWGATPPLEGEWPARRGGQRRLRVRSFELGPGCVAGSTDFYLARPHGTRAVCASVACRVLRLSRHAMMRMAAEAPVALNILQMAIMRLNSSDLSTAADAAAAAL